MGPWAQDSTRRPFRPPVGPIRKALGRIFGGLWRSLKALAGLMFVLLLGSGGTLLVVCTVLVRAAFASIFLWLGWNHGIVPLAGPASMPWTMAFWCSVLVAGVALPFARTGATATMTQETE